MRIPQPPVRTLLFVNIDRQPLQPIIVVVGSSGLDGSDVSVIVFSDLYLSSSLSQPAVIPPAKIRKSVMHNDSKWFFINNRF